jgi:two-component system, NtrC family, sensor kinase
VAPSGPGERAVHLPWVWPDAASLADLADDPRAITWEAASSDPGFLFTLLAFDIPLPTQTTPAAFTADGLRTLADRLSIQVPWVDWSDTPELAPVLRTAVAAARFSELLCSFLHTDEVARAGAGTWLAFAGWLSVGITQPTGVAEVLRKQANGTDPRDAQQECWGRTRAEIAWQLSGNWPVPTWAVPLLGRIDVTPDEAERYGGDRKLQAIVQVAILLAEQAETRLYLSDEFDLAEAFAELGLRSADLDRIRETYAQSDPVTDWLTREWSDPRTSPWLVEQLELAADELERDAAMAEPPTVLIDVSDERIHAAKMAAVAEFAAGAGHEINNPLAVISGHSQYLLRHEADDDRKKALQSIIRQTERVHALLTELMYFARPPAIKRQWVEVGRCVQEAAAAVATLADHRQVTIATEPLHAPLWIDADPKHLNIALSALIRNGVEAAPVGGWVRVRTAFPGERLEVIVDDSGPGPDPQSRHHLFDPFYSGRTAGRGRGLGLPAAWRLAQEHGGTVRFVPLTDGPTRFILSLPAAVVVPAVQRKSA